jgi:hypothetical protein
MNWVTQYFHKIKFFSILEAVQSMEIFPKMWLWDMSVTSKDDKLKINIFFYFQFLKLLKSEHVYELYFKVDRGHTDSMEIA